jgi:hypothetical protein
LLGDEDVERVERIDQEIAEVWRTATAPTSSVSAVMTHGALLELLQSSEFVDDYRALAAQEMELETDVETARQVLVEAFHKLRLRRLERECNARAAEFEQDRSPERLSAYQQAYRAYSLARGGATGDAESAAG